MHSALEDLKLDRITIVCPGEGDYPLTENVRVAGLRTLARESRDFHGGAGTGASSSPKTVMIGK